MGRQLSRSEEGLIQASKAQGQSGGSEYISNYFEPVFFVA